MTADAFKRKLIALLSANLEGYSRLIGEDEDATFLFYKSAKDKTSGNFFSINKLNNFFREQKILCFIDR